jgi:DNA-binding transcriptional LysR family regulator
MTLDLRRLRYFVAVAEEGHITRASERLGIQQAPLSQQIKTLERELDARLFHRLPRGVAMTDAGAALLTEARAVLARIDQAEAAVLRAARGEAGRLSVAFTHSACFHPLTPAAIRAFREAAPQVALRFDLASTTDLMGRLRSNDVDVAFIRTTSPRPDGLQLYRLSEEAMVVALPTGHPLTRAAAIDMADLEGEALISYPRSDGAGLYDAIIAACHACNFSPRIVHETPQMISRLNLVAAGLGISIVPESLQRMKLDGVEYRTLTGEAPPRAQLNLAVRRGEGSTVVGRFIEVVRTTAGHGSSKPATDVQDIARRTAERTDLAAEVTGLGSPP